MTSDQACRLVVCRGCCCGTRKKVPGVDHQAHLERLSDLRDRSADAPASVQVSDCLGICFMANVVVVRPSPAGRAAGARPVWLGEVTTETALENVESWVAAGGPGVAPMPEPLSPHLTHKDAKKPKKGKKGEKESKKKKKKDKKGKGEKSVRG